MYSPFGLKLKDIPRLELSVKWEDFCVEYQIVNDALCSTACLFIYLPANQIKASNNQLNLSVRCYDINVFGLSMKCDYITSRHARTPTNTDSSYRLKVMNQVF